MHVLKVVNNFNKKKMKLNNQHVFDRYAIITALHISSRYLLKLLDMRNSIIIIIGMFYPLCITYGMIKDLINLIVGRCILT